MFKRSIYSHPLIIGTMALLFSGNFGNLSINFIPFFPKSDLFTFLIITYFCSLTCSFLYSGAGSFPSRTHLDEDNLFGEEEEQNLDGEGNHNIQPNSTKLNYHSYMNRPQSLRWSKADTELFYQVADKFDHVSTFSCVYKKLCNLKINNNELIIFPWRNWICS